MKSATSTPKTYHALYLVDMCIVGVVSFILLVCVAEWLPHHALEFVVFLYFSLSLALFLALFLSILVLVLEDVEMINVPSFLVVGAHNCFRHVSRPFEVLSAFNDFTLRFRWVLSSYFERKFY